MSGRPAFTITTLPETDAYWSAIAREEIVMPRCNVCGSFYFPPLPVCPKCASKDVGLAPVSGRATLYSYVIAENAWPEWNAEGPMSVALVRLEEGIMLTSTVIGCAQTPEALCIDMPLIAAFLDFGSRKMLVFKPMED